MISLTAETSKVPVTPEPSYGFITRLSNSNELPKLRWLYSQASAESGRLLQLMPSLQQGTHQQRAASVPLGPPPYCWPHDKTVTGEPAQQSQASPPE